MFVSREFSRKIIDLRCQYKILRRLESSAAANPKLNYTIKEVTIPTPDGHLAGKLWEGLPGVDTGKKSLPIICTHGYLDNAGSFDHLIPLLMKPNATFFALDFPGHGLSSHTLGSQYNLFIDGYLGIHRAIRYFEWEKVILLGHSMGSAVSFLFSGIFPEYVDRYIGLDHFHPIPKDAIFQIRQQVDSVFDLEAQLAKNSPTPSYSYEEIVKKFYDRRKSTIGMEGCRALMKRGSSQLPDGKYEFRYDIRSTRSPGHGRFSKEQNDFIGRGIKCPVCIIRAENGTKPESEEVFMDYIENTRKVNPRIELHIVPGTHHVHLNEPQVPASIINYFLES